MNPNFGTEIEGLIVKPNYAMTCWLANTLLDTNVMGPGNGAKV